MNASFKTVALLAAIGAPMLHAQAQREAPSTQHRLDRATSGLALTAEQRARIDALASRYADPQPGDGWRLAADLESLLTDEQVQSLAEKRAAQRTRRAKRAERADRQDGAARAEHQKAHRRHRAADHLGLSEPQRAEVKALRQAARAEHDALREQLQSGAVTDEQFAAQARALRARSKADLASVLTSEQRERVAEREARHEARRSAREAVLRITPEQQAAFEAARAEMGGGKARASLRDRTTEILTEDQRAIVAVHRALMKRPGQRGHPRHHGAGQERPGRGAVAE